MISTNLPSVSEKPFSLTAAIRDKIIQLRQEQHLLYYITYNFYTHYNKSHYAEDKTILKDFSNIDFTNCNGTVTYLNYDFKQDIDGKNIHQKRENIADNNSTISISPDMVCHIQSQTVIFQLLKTYSNHCLAIKGQLPNIATR